MKDKEKIKIAREETDLEWRPVLDGVHAYADLRRLGRRLAAERHVTDETIAYLAGELEGAIADVEKLTRELDEARDHRDLATGKLLMVGSEIGGDPKLDPKDQRDPRWTPTLEEAAKLRADALRLRGALRLAEGPIAIAASYADQPCETMGMRGHAKDCARVLPEIRAALAGEGEAKRCTWTYDETHFAWDSSCGEKWILMDGGPSENEIRFCHGCGKPVEVACEATPEKARQP